MDHSDLLADAFSRIRDRVGATLKDLPADYLTARVDPGANTVAWLIWHLTRVQDHHIADVAGRDQLWEAGGWREQFGLPFRDDVSGYGQSTDEVGLVHGSVDLLTRYHDAVSTRTVEYVNGVSAADLDRIVDDNFDPPVTLAARLVSVIADDLQHVGQAAYVRGLLERRSGEPAKPD